MKNYFANTFPNNRNQHPHKAYHSVRFHSSSLFPGQHNSSTASMTYLFCQMIWPNYYHIKLRKTQYLANSASISHYYYSQTYQKELPPFTLLRKSQSCWQQPADYKSCCLSSWASWLSNSSVSWINCREQESHSNPELTDTKIKQKHYPYIFLALYVSGEKKSCLCAVEDKRMSFWVHQTHWQLVLVEHPLTKVGKPSKQQPQKQLLTRPKE